MQLPDENIEYQYQRLLAPHPEAWTPLAEIQSQHFLPPERLEAIKKTAMEIRGQVAGERELQNPPPKLRPPGRLHRPAAETPRPVQAQQDASELGRSSAPPTGCARTWIA